MRMHPLAVLPAALILACGTAEPAYIGSWTPDESQTDVTNVTMSYEAIDSMTYQVSVDGQTFTMVTDGSEFATPWGGTMTTVPVDSLSWASMFRVDGNVISTDTMWLAADGQTLSSRSHRQRADGGTDVSEMTMTRASGGPGLAGTWRGSSVSGSMMGELSFTAMGDTAVAINYTSMEATCSPTLGGGDVPATSPMFDGTWTCALAEREDGGLTLTWKRSGEPRYVAEYSVSADGDTLTEVSTATEVNEPVTVVYTRKAEAMP